MRRAWLICLLVLFSLTYRVSHAQTLKIALPELPPFISLQGHGQPVGLFVDILDEVLQRNNFQSEFNVLPWKRALLNVENGQADLTLLSLNIGWTKQKFFLTDKLLHRNIVMITTKKVPTLKYIDDAVDLQIGTVSGDSLETELGGRAIPYISIPSIEMGMKMVAFGRIDALLTYEYPSIYQAHHLGIEAKIKRHLVKTQPIFIGLSKKKAALRRLLPYFNQTIREMRSDGTLQKILKNHRDQFGRFNKKPPSSPESDIS